jgi:hypothetical protein
MLTSQFTSLSLKLVASILIISSIVDYITLAIPFKIQDVAWKLTFAGKLVDRGVVPLLGIVFLLLGYWIDSNTNSANSTKNSKFDFKIPAFIIASTLGLIFLLIVPFHISNLSQFNSAVVTQIRDGADQAETKAKAELEQLSQLANNPEQLKQLDTQIQTLTQAIGSGQLQGQALNPVQIQQLEQEKKQRQVYRELAKNPKAIKAKLNEIQNQIRGQKLERENNEKTKIIVEGIRTVLTSIMLAIGYIVLGWLGLRYAGK